MTQKKKKCNTSRIYPMNEEPKKRKNIEFIIQIFVEKKRGGRNWAIHSSRQILRQAKEKKNLAKSTLISTSYKMPHYPIHILLQSQIPIEN